MRRIVLVVSLFLGVVLGVSCKSSTAPDPPQIKHPPVITSFTVSPTDCLYGEDTTTVLAWNVTGATAVSIDQGVGTVTASGTKTVNPTSTTTWTLSASNSDGPVSKNCTFTITPGAHFILASYSYGWTPDIGTHPKINGVVRNDGNLAGYDVTILFRAHNANWSNVVLDTARGYPSNMGDIAPLQTADFEAVFNNLDQYSWPNVTNVTYEFTWLNRATGLRVLQVGNVPLK